MCDPATLMIAATVASSAATAYAGYTSYQGAKMQEATAKLNRSYEERATRDAMDRGEKEAMAHYRKVSALRGEQMAQYGAMGLDLSSGSPADIISDTNILGNEDANTIRENAFREAEGHRISAQNYESEAAMAKFQQTTIPITTALNVGSTLLGGFGKTRELMNAQGSATHAGASSVGGFGSNTAKPGGGIVVGGGPHGGGSGVGGYLGRNYGGRKGYG